MPARQSSLRAKLLRIAVAAASLVALPAQAGPQDAEAVDPDYRPFRVVSYNVAMGLAYRVHMQLGTLKGPGIAWSVRDNKRLQQPDVLGLQEVCLTAGAQVDYLVAAMQAAHPGRRIFHAEATDGGQLDATCSNAQVTLTVHPIRASGRFEFPMLSWRNAALWVDLDVRTVRAFWNSSGRLRIYNLHLINRVGRSVAVPEARWTQAQALLAHYQAFREAEPDTPVIWLGDFNALGDVLHPWRQERTIVELSKIFTPSLEGFHPTHFLLQQTDWIFADRMVPLRSRVVLLPYSDHFPVVADY